MPFQGADHFHPSSLEAMAITVLICLFPFFLKTAGPWKNHNPLYADTENDHCNGRTADPQYVTLMGPRSRMPRVAGNQLFLTLRYRPEGLQLPAFPQQRRLRGLQPSSIEKLGSRFWSRFRGSGAGSGASAECRICRYADMVLCWHCHDVCNADMTSCWLVVILP